MASCMYWLLLVYLCTCRLILSCVSSQATLPVASLQPHPQQQCLLRLMYAYNCQCNQHQLLLHRGCSKILDMPATWQNMPHSSSQP